MLIKDITQSNSFNFKDTPRHLKANRLRTKLSKNLTKPHRRILLQIIDEYDLILDLSSEQNYQKGMRDGFKLASFLLKPTIKFPKN